MGIHRQDWSIVLLEKSLSDLGNSSLFIFFLCSGILKLHLALLQKFHETAQAWGLEQRISWSLTKDSISCLAIFLCRFLSLPTAALSAYL